jgi:hypothetical protein
MTQPTKREQLAVMRLEDFKAHLRTIAGENPKAEISGAAGATVRKELSLLYAADVPLTSRFLVQIARRSIRVRAPVVETTGILQI